MRALIVSDIHANLVALDAVLEHAESGGPIDAVWNAGDAVGYGPQPSECIARLRELGALWVAGNHERAATGAIDTSEFNTTAAAAAEWTVARLSDEEKSYLDDLPETLTEGNFVLVHGTLRHPIWEYLYDSESAGAHISLMQVQFSIVGHTHVPMKAVLEDGQAECSLVRLKDGARISLDGVGKVVLNPGSVGQPRDGDPRASYGVYDSDEDIFTIHRVDYDIKATQALMLEAGLPAWLYERLEIGR
jgi:diadenosine tetraphosphatase ApaH/serine/threonine PP2A family protein phosphatase